MKKECIFANEGRLFCREDACVGWDEVYKRCSIRAGLINHPFQMDDLVEALEDIAKSLSSISTELS